MAHKNYSHLIRAMRPGDVIYLPEWNKRLDKQIVGVMRRCKFKGTTANFVAVNLNPASAHRVVRIEREAE